MLNEHHNFISTDNNNNICAMLCHDVANFTHFGYLIKLYLSSFIFYILRL